MRTDADRDLGPVDKEPLDIDEIFRRLRAVAGRLPLGAMFELRDRGYGRPFEQLVGSVISARTRDETTVAVCRRLFSVARTPEAVAALDQPQLERLIEPATFADAKARDIREIARRVAAAGGQVPDTMEGLMAFRGVGPKIAALTLGVAWGRPDAIAVDVHVHRITNRWGYVATTSPEATRAALEAILPKRYWIEINERVVPFGRVVCTGERPRCSECVLRTICRQVGVFHPR